MSTIHPHLKMRISSILYIIHSLLLFCDAKHSIHKFGSMPQNKMMHWRVHVPQMSPREIYVFHVDSYGNWSEWGECLLKDCIEIRYRECLDDSWKYFSSDRPDTTKCASKFYAEKRPCRNTTQCNAHIGQQMLKNVSDVCGIKGDVNKYQMKILGGKTTEPHSWPWAVRLSYKTRSQQSVSFCGGTLITPEWILTAAHCLLYEKRYLPFGKPIVLADYLKTTIHAHLGDHDQNKQEEAQSDVRVLAAIIHPKYHRRLQTDGYDIALLRLEKPITVSSAINYACLPNADMNLKPGSKCYAVGWGTTKGATYPPSIHSFQRLMESLMTPFSSPFSQLFNHPFSTSLLRHRRTPNKVSVDKLREVDLPIVSISQCNRHYTGISQDLHICAGAKGKDTCAGDSGGGLYCQSSDGNQWTVVGVTSFGMARGCGLNPGVYTSTRAHLSWITKQIASNIDQL